MKCRAITKENRHGRKPFPFVIGSGVRTGSFIFYISQMKSQHTVLRTFINKPITKLCLPFVCLQTSVMLTVNLEFDVFNSRTHLRRLENFQNLSHC